MGFPPSRGRPSQASRPPLIRRCGATNGVGGVFSLAGKLAASERFRLSLGSRSEDKGAFRARRQKTPQGRERHRKGWNHGFVL